MSAPILLSWSGGKDAAWALHALRRRGEHEVVALLTTLTDDDDRVAMQGIRRTVLQAQATAVDLPLIEAWLPRAAGNIVYEDAFATALLAARARWPALPGIAFGDLFLADVRAWREELCARLGWTAHFPLFGSATATLARDMHAGGLEATVCCVDTQQLDAAFCGRDFDAALLRALPAACDPCGENGEFHTLVHDGPMFSHPIALVRGETALRDARFAQTDFGLADG